MNQQPQVGGRYELGELLGRGGMAEVRKGYDVRLGRTVAVKRLRTDLASDSTFQARFRREAQSSASLNHPKIVAVYDTGEELATDGSDVAQPYIVMEYVAGRTLRDILREGRKILPERALEIVAGVCEALDYSHRAGIIHRDIKPGNVMLTPSGDVKVMDFGIARAVADATSNMTQTAAVVGTAQYLSPEQARGETVDSRSDVYSAGCVLYELLTGQPPFSGDSPVSVAYQHVREQAPPPSTIEPDLPPEIDAIVMKALAKPLDQRYQSAAAMKADIDRFLAGQQVQAPPVVPAQSPSDGTPTAVAGAQHTAVFTPVDQEDDEDDRRTVWWVLLGLALAALLVLGVLFGPKLFSGPAQVRVPDVVGEKQAAAEQAIDEAGLAVGEVELQTSELVPRGTVISQDPEEGDFADEGAVVDLVVSAGKEPRTVPYLIGEPREDAAAELRQLDLKPRFRTIESEEPKGIVVEMDPVPYTPVPAGSTVVLVVSEGPRQVPSVIGKTEERAIAILEDAGYDVNVVEDASTPSKPGTVLDQSPGAFQNAPRGSTVTITVSRYEEPEPEPSPTPSPSVEPSPTEPTPTP